MKLWKWLLIGFGGTAIILAFFGIYPVAILNKSWWWLGIPSIFFFLAWIIVGIIILVTRLRKKAPEKIKINLKDAKQRAIYEIKYDEDNPDNFKIDKYYFGRAGDKNFEQTPILILDGKGTELNERIVMIMNLNNPKHEITRLGDVSPEEVVKRANAMAEHPIEEEKKEQITIGTDIYGKPETKIVRPTTMEKQEQEEKQKAEESNAM